MIVLGDSIMWGLTGFGSNHPRANPTIPQAIGDQLGWEVDNEAISGTKYADNRDGQDFIPQVNKFNFKNYDVVLLGYGINDYDDQPYATTTQVQDAMTKGIAKIRADNPSIHIYVELPTPSYVYGATDGALNGGGISERTMYDAIKQCAKDNNCPVYDWRDKPLITYDNRNQTLGDGQIHPVQAVQTQMAKRLATWIAEEEQQTTSQPTKPATPTNPSTPTTPSIVVPDPTPTPTPKPAETISLNTSVGTGSFIDNVNSNFKKIWSALQKVSGDDATDFPTETFSSYSRGLRMYLAESVRTITGYAQHSLGSTETTDSDGRSVSVEGYTLTNSLLIKDIVDSLNGWFKDCQTAINAMLKNL
ncbi:SGNH/GDSL hydrolase family protein [Limosilactobacillus allomucosae]|uniref:SGNH/GDSL hydrolase family protein n=1 Tax=Limosilactobacillus allomucosae TaxID=3142938 RepID=A0AAU7C5Q8_9LACO